MVSAAAIPAAAVVLLSLLGAILLVLRARDRHSRDLTESPPEFRRAGKGTDTRPEVAGERALGRVSWMRGGGGGV